MITGSCVALITPMLTDGTIDFKALGLLTDWHIQEKTDAIVVLGTTGESPVLTEKERTEILRFVIDRVDGRIPVIAGTGTNSTEQTIYLTEQARVLGANACLLVVPYYNRPGQEGLYQHFHRIAERVPVAQILYNVPGRTITDLLPETVVRLMDHPNIIGIKEATGDIERAKMLINAAEGKNFAVYSGDDLTAFELMLCGGKGVISVTANIAPAKMHKMCSETLRGHTEEAKAIDQQLSGLNKALFVEANPVPVKWALNKMRKIQNGIRLPLVPLQSESHPVVSEAMKSSGIFVSEM